MRQRARVGVWVLAIAALAVVLRLAYGHAAVGYDALYSLVWGDELAHFQAPDYGAQLSPTSHPLANLVGLLASLFGDSGPNVLAGLSFVTFAGLGVAAFAAGQRSFGPVTGVLFAGILLT